MIKRFLCYIKDKIWISELPVPVLSTGTGNRPSVGKGGGGINMNRTYNKQ
jgi:hypothetical protein